jgi:hypothetical protein
MVDITPEQLQMFASVISQLQKAKAQPKAKSQKVYNANAFANEKIVDKQNITIKLPVKGVLKEFDGYKGKDKNGNPQIGVSTKGGSVLRTMWYNSRNEYVKIADEPQFTETIVLKN